MEPLVIIHGWSDTSQSFKKLAKFIKDNLGMSATELRLADWESMDNDVTYADLAEAMQREWQRKSLSTAPRSVNIIVHSTGALVTREWMTRYFKPDTVPIKRLVMLAPANFGSPLAHKGRSFLGRAVKGWANENFETGDAILKGLELASPYTWALADKDLFTTESWYGKQRILATVFVGNSGYSGLRSIANEDGSDGTVRISTANLNASRISAQLDDRQQLIAAPSIVESNGKIAFAIVDKFNHGSITFNEDVAPNIDRPFEQMLFGALSVTDAAYDSDFAWQTELDMKLGTASSKTPLLQNMVVRLRDHIGNSIDDYFVEFYRKGSDDHHFEQTLYSQFLKSVHAYSDDSSYRSLYVDVGELARMRSTRVTSFNKLFISISAKPVYLPETKHTQPVGYAPVSENSTGGLRLDAAHLDKVFQPHRTTFVDISLTRKLSESVFKLT